MLKRGQISIFIILGVLIVSILVILFLFKEKLMESVFIKDVSDVSNLPPKALAVYNHVLDCVDLSAKEVMFVTAFQGGYYKPKSSDEFRLDDLGYTGYLPYYLVDGSEMYPTLDIISKELSFGIKDKFPLCLNFSQFAFDVNSNMENIIVETEIDKAYIDFFVGFPVTVKKDSTSYRLNKFKKVVRTNYSNFYNLAVDLTKDQKNKANYFCVSCANQIANSHNLSIYTNEYVENTYYTIIYYLIDEEAIDEPVKVFTFAHKFSLTEGK